MKSHSKKIVFVTVLCLIGGLASYKLGHAIFGADKYHFSLDAQLSTAMHKAIKDAVNESGIMPLAGIAESVRTVCPAVANVAVERRANKSLHIIVEADKPYLCFAGKSVLLSSGSVVDKKCFKKAVLKDLPIVACKEHGDANSEVSPDFIQWLLHLDTDIFAQYAITWIDDYEICLQDKQDNHAMIMCSIDTPLDEKIRDVCQRIIGERIDHAQGTVRDYLYTADIRFEKQIIISLQKGGACNG